MYAGLKKIDYRMVGWSWMLWDWNWFQRANGRLGLQPRPHRIGNGDIVVMHDGDESAPFADQRHTVEATARLLPELRATRVRASARSAIRIDASQDRRPIEYYSLSPLISIPSC